MSHDILAFDPEPVADADFFAWWEVQLQWSENHSDEDLRRDTELESRMTDYSMVSDDGSILRP